MGGMCSTRLGQPVATALRRGNPANRPRARAGDLVIPNTIPTMVDQKRRQATQLGPGGPHRPGTALVWARWWFYGPVAAGQFPARENRNGRKGATRRIGGKRETGQPWGTTQGVETQWWLRTSVSTTAQPTGGGQPRPLLLGCFLSHARANVKFSTPGPRNPRNQRAHTRAPANTVARGVAQGKQPVGAIR